MTPDFFRGLSAQERRELVRAVYGSAQIDDHVALFLELAEKSERGESWTLRDHVRAVRSIVRERFRLLLRRLRGR